MRTATKLLMLLCLLLSGQYAIAQSAGTVTYEYTDQQGTPLAEADANGNITATFDYTPYGTTALGTAPNGPGYTGHVNDPGTNLIYMQARYYDPATGHFLSVDPTDVSPGNVFLYNRYSYANNNPIVNVDPNGKQVDESAKYVAVYSQCAQTRGCNPAQIPDQIAKAQEPYGNLVSAGLPIEDLLGPAIKMMGSVATNVLDRIQLAREISQFIKAASVEYKGGLSVAARKIESHAQRIGGTFEKLTGTVAEKNEQAQGVIESILKDPNAVRKELSGGGVEYRIGEDGKGVRFNKDGSFNTVLDPRVPKSSN